MLHHNQPLAHLNHPHPKTKFPFLTKILHGAIYLGGILGPIFTIPQLVTIVRHESAQGVSLVSWSAYLGGAFVWLIYGIIHRERPIIFNYGIWVLVDLAIVIAIIFYR